MRVKEVRLLNFRNYEAIRFEAGPGRNIIYGANGAGKTNLLEALYFCLSGNSFRTSREEEVIGPTGSKALLYAMVATKNGDVETGVEITPVGKRLILSGKETTREVFPGRGSLLLFTPEDLLVAVGSPGDRRRFFDRLFSGLIPGYRGALRAYSRALEQRNTLLRACRSARKPPEDLSVWTEALAEAASSLYHLRLKGLSLVAPAAARCFRPLTGKKLAIRYASTVPLGADEAAIKEQILAALAALRADELKCRQTLVGPARDDYILLVEDKHLRRYGSRGEQRAAVLALKLAEAELLEKERGEDVIYLLDDVFSELDDDRRLALLRATAARQTFITTTQRLPLGEATFFQVQNGIITPEHGANV
ncbi:DNA replication/repair protein RecF [Thermodesulfitimonas sp.]